VLARRARGPKPAIARACRNAPRCGCGNHKKVWTRAVFVGLSLPVTLEPWLCSPSSFWSARTSPTLVGGRIPARLLMRSDPARPPPSPPCHRLCTPMHGHGMALPTQSPTTVAPSRSLTTAWRARRLRPLWHTRRSPSDLTRLLLLFPNTLRVAGPKGTSSDDTRRGTQLWLRGAPVFVAFRPVTRSTVVLLAPPPGHPERVGRWLVVSSQLSC